MIRYLEDPIRKDIREKIVLLSGPRRVGKTTLSRQLVPSYAYLNYDADKDRIVLEKQEWPRDVELVILDEIHKRKNWKSWIKGIYDTEGIPPGLLVTGSARLDILRRGGESLAGRFFSFRLHPLTVREAHESLGDSPQDALDALLRFGGFPEPYLKKDETAARRWRRSHIDTIIRGDLLDTEQVRSLKSVEILVDLLRERVGSPTSSASLARDLQVSTQTVQRWLRILEDLCVIFTVTPYHKNIARSLLKEPKHYFYDIGAVEGGSGARLENAVAAAMLREAHLIEDTTGKRASLHYLRDRNKNEVDFLAVIDRKPVLMAEVKSGDDSFAKALFLFREMLPGVKAVQIVAGLDRKRHSSGVDMVPAAPFLAGLTLG